MNARRHLLMPLLLAVCCSFTVSAIAAPRWISLLPFKRVEADPKKEYWVGEENGPWMIYVASFAGDGALKKAQELTLELRRDYKVNAYMHKRHVDYSKPVQGIGLNKYGGPKMMRYKHGAKYDQIAVLIGDYEVIDDPNLEKLLEKMKYARPRCLEIRDGGRSSQQLAVFREIQKHFNGNPEKNKKGPMGTAFATRNPLLPDEYFAAESLDRFVLDMNRGVEFSLLDNEGVYTVQVASFRGESQLDIEKPLQSDANSRRGESKLAEAFDNAHRLTMALRKKGVEAFEFHDRHESIVAVGSFQSIGTPRPDGSIDINPEVLSVMKTYGAERQELPGQTLSGLRPKSLAGIRFDVQPIPILVPRNSVAAAYAGNSSFDH